MEFRSADLAEGEIPQGKPRAQRVVKSPRGNYGNYFMLSLLGLRSGLVNYPLVPLEEGLVRDTLVEYAPHFAGQAEHTESAEISDS
jgi:hypothetical protein